MRSRVTPLRVIGVLVLAVALAGAHFAWVKHDLDTYRTDVSAIKDRPDFSAERMQAMPIPRRFREAHAFEVKMFEGPGLDEIRSMTPSERAHLTEANDELLRQESDAFEKAVWPWSPVFEYLDY